MVGSIISGGLALLASKAQAGAAGDAAALSAQATRDTIVEQRRQFDLSRSDFAPYRETGANALAQYSALFGIGRGGGANGAPEFIDEQFQTSPGSTRQVENPNYSVGNGEDGEPEFISESTAPTFGTRQVSNPDFQAGNAFLSREEMDEARDRFVETPGYNFRFDEGLRALDRSASARGRLQGGGITREVQRYGQGIAADEFNNYANRLAGIAGMGQGATQSTATLGANSATNIGNALQAGAQQQGNALMAAGTARASGFAGAANAVNSGIQNYQLGQYLNRGPSINASPWT